ncbi:MAG: hypothetical protein IJ555_13685 [Ruminococcus sp.]|nr:hypothetical protein [Ruminococcus sp.]
MIISSYLVEYEEPNKYGSFFGEILIASTSAEEAIEDFKATYPDREVVDCQQFTPMFKIKPNAWKLDRVLDNLGYDHEARELLFGLLTSCTFVDLKDPTKKF